MRFAYREPAIQSTKLEDGLPKDVVAEWAGTQRTDIERSDESVQTTSAPDPRSAPQIAHRGEFSTDSVVRRATACEYPIDGEALLFDPSTQFLHYLNATAFFIWRACDRRTIHEVASLLTERFDVDADIALLHVEQIVGLLGSGGLVFMEEANDAPS